MNATKQYQFVSLLCILSASTFTMVGMSYSIVHTIKNLHPFWILPLLIALFFGVQGQARMITMFHDYLKRRIK